MPLLEQDSSADIHCGSVELTLANRNGRTRLTHIRTRPPLLVQQALYPDAGMPHLALVMLSNPTGGIFQGDQHRIAVAVEPGAAAHVTGQGATRIHAMPHGRARQDVVLKVASGGYLEYLPDPVIPYRDSHFEQRLTLEVAAGGTLVYWDIICPGRIAMGESFRYRRLSSRLEVVDAGDRMSFREAFTLDPTRNMPLAGFGLPDGQVRPRGCTLGSMLLIADGPEMEPLLAGLQELVSTIPDVAVGATRLPNRVGLGVRALGVDTATVRSALTQCWAVARKHLLGTSLPFLRKY